MGLGFVPGLRVAGLGSPVNGPENNILFRHSGFQASDYRN